LHCAFSEASEAVFRRNRAAPDRECDETLAMEDKRRNAGVAAHDCDEMLAGSLHLPTQRR
jgi:hypothetical protein